VNGLVTIWTLPKASSTSTNFAQELVVVAGDVGHLRAALGLGQDAADDVAVLLRPVELRLQGPAVDDVADQVQVLALVGFEEVGEERRLAGRRARCTSEIQRLRYFMRGRVAANISPPLKRVSRRLNATATVPTPHAAKLRAHEWHKAADRLRRHGVWARSRHACAQRCCPALMAEHDVTVFAGGDAVPVLSPLAPVVKIPTLGYAYSHRGDLSVSGTVARNFSGMSDLRG